MAFQILEAGEITIIKVFGDLDVYSSQDLTSRFTILVKEGRCDLAFDLEEVQFVDSSGVAALVRACQVLQRHGRKLVLLHPSEMVRKVLRSMTLESLFEIREPESIPSGNGRESREEWRRSKRILVVAELSLVRSATKDILLEEGYGVVLEAHDHLTALRLASRHMIHLLIVDLSHPLDSTTRLLDALRASGQEIPVVVTSAGRWRTGAASDSPAMSGPGSFALDGDTRRKFLTLINSALSGEELGFKDYLRARLGMDAYD